MKLEREDNSSEGDDRGEGRSLVVTQHMAPLFLLASVALLTFLLCSLGPALMGAIGCFHIFSDFILRGSVLFFVLMDDDVPEYYFECSCNY